MATYTIATINDYVARARRRDLFGSVALVLFSLAIALIFIAFPPGWYAVIASAAVALLLASWQRPVVGVAAVLGLTIFFEQFEFAYFRPLSTLVPFFARLSTFTRFGALVISPLELMLVALVVVVVLRALLGKQPLRLTPVTAPMAVFACGLGVWSVYGVLMGGSANIVVQEMRGFIYLIVLSLLVPSAVRRDSDVDLLLWVAIGGVVVKALQGVYAYFVILNRDTTGVQAITSHEDALFIAWMFVLLAGMLAYKKFPANRTVLVAAAPFMAFTFVLTERRAAYVALAIGMMVLAVLLATDPGKRRLVAGATIPAVLAIALVLGVVAANPLALGRTGRTIASIMSPSSTEDVESNYYRRAEEMNLIFTIRSAPMLGLGFGRPYQEVEKLATIDFSLASYVPHNEIVWIWTDMGTIGFGLFWAVVGTLIAYGCIAFRQTPRDRTKVLSGFVTAAIAMQMVVSYVDLQLTFARNMVFLGVLIGILGCLRMLDGQGGAADVA